MSLDHPSEEKWWEFVDLQKLIVANNFITEIPGDIGRLTSLQTLDVIAQLIYLEFRDFVAYICLMFIY